MRLLLIHSDGFGFQTKSQVPGATAEEVSDEEHALELKDKVLVIFITVEKEDESDPEKAAEMLDTCLDKYDFMAEPDFDWTIKPQNPGSFPAWMNVYRLIFYQLHFDQLLADKWAESNYRLYELYLRTLTMRRGSRLLLAIKQYYNQHGTWPPDLDSIKNATPAEAFLDPVTGKPLQYENHGQRFSLYGEKTNVWPR